MIQRLLCILASHSGYTSTEPVVEILDEPKVMSPFADKCLACGVLDVDHISDA